MGIPSVNFEVLNGALGGTDPQADGVCGLVIGLSGAGTLGAGVAKAIYSLSEAVDLSLSKLALADVTDFYTMAGDGQELWLMAVADDMSLATVFDKTEAYAKKLITASSGRIRMIGASVERTDGYTVTVKNGLDGDVYDALLKAQALGDEMASKYMPVRCILPGYAWSGDVSALQDLKEGTQNRVQISLLGREGSKDGRVGFLLGLYSSIGVQRNPGRVANGDLGISEAYLTDGVTTAEDIINTQDTLHDKGYIFPIRRVGRTGYYFNDDPTATSNTDDYNSFARGRVIDKVQRLAYDVYLDFINDDYGVDTSGSINPAELKRLQGSIEDAVNNTMTAANEVSNFESYVDAAQNTLANGETKVQLLTQPRAYHKVITVELGFSQTLE